MLILDSASVFNSINNQTLFKAMKKKRNPYYEADPKNLLIYNRHSNNSMRYIYFLSLRSLNSEYKKLKIKHMVLGILLVDQSKLISSYETLI